MKKIQNKFPKTAIGELPRVAFQGRIITVESEQEAEKAVRYLLSQEILGFDTETKPNFTSGRMNAVALLQVSSRDTCFLFRLNHIGIPDCLIRLLSDTEVLKVGLSWHDDIRQLRQRREFTAGLFVELQTMAAEFGIKDMSLQKLYANIFGQKISKSQQLSNWEADVLREPQKLYAATDAWACIMLYEELLRMRQDGYLLEVVPETEPYVLPKPKEQKEPKKPRKPRKPKQEATEQPEAQEPKKPRAPRKPKQEAKEQPEPQEAKAPRKPRRTARKAQQEVVQQQAPVQPKEETKGKIVTRKKPVRSKRAKSQVAETETTA